MHQIKNITAISLLIAGLGVAKPTLACEHDGCSEEVVHAVRQMIDHPFSPEAESDTSLSPEPVEEPVPPISPNGSPQQPKETPARNLEGHAERIRRNDPKPQPTVDSSTYEAQASIALDAEPMLSLRFAAGTYSPPAGLDLALADTVPVLVGEGRSTTYGFLLSDEYLIAETRAEIERYGVEFLSNHSNAYKVRLPLDLEALEAVVELDFVHWVGFSLPEQKLSHELQPSLENPGSGEVALIVSLFESGPEEQFRRQIENAGLEIARYHNGLEAYTVLAPAGVLTELVALDFVQYIEPVRSVSAHHDESVPMIGGDYIRVGGTIGTRFDGSTTIVGLLDSGADTSDQTGHVDLDKATCHINYTLDPEPANIDLRGHGSHVLGTIAGTGSGNPRNAGMAPGVGSLAAARIRNAKVLRASDGTGTDQMILDGMTFMSWPAPSACSSDRPHVINASLGASPANGVQHRGTDALSIHLDDMTYQHHQLYVVSAGNDGSLGSGSINAPGAAKNALTVGSVIDRPEPTLGAQVGDISDFSSLGSTGDNRMKPNVVAPGESIVSVASGTGNGYVSNQGTSMAAPHVTGLLATLMEHESDFQDTPRLARAFMMATSMLHDDDVTPGNNGSGVTRATYGLGRVSSFIAHWDDSPPTSSWSRDWKTGYVYAGSPLVWSINVPQGTERMVVVLTWDEPGASAGASSAVLDDIDLWVDVGADCSAPNGECGEFASQSTVDNVEYLIIDQPGDGLFDIKATATSVCSSGGCTGRNVGLAAVMITGDPTPYSALSVTTDDPSPKVGDVITLTTTVENPEYIAAGVRLSLDSMPPGANFLGVETTREDGQFMEFFTADALTLGDVRAGLPRSADWRFQIYDVGINTFAFSTYSNNAGTDTEFISVDAYYPPDLLISATTASPIEVFRNDPISVSATVENISVAHAPGSNLDFVLSGDSTIGTNDLPLGAPVSVGPLGDFDSTTLSSTVAISSSGVWYLGACVDPVANEDDLTNNCSSTGGVQVIVNSRPRLAVLSIDLDQLTIATDEPYAVNTEVKNFGPAGSPATDLEYFLSEDQVLDSQDDPLGNTSIPALSAGSTATQSSTFVTPSETGEFYVFACLVSVPGDDDLSDDCSEGAKLLMPLTLPGGGRR